jgi:hypothetical protein
MNIIPDKQTTTSNTVLVGAYTGLASGAVYMADKRLDWNLDGIETAFLVTAISAVAAFVWNKLKDRGVVTDNRA